MRTGESCINEGSCIRMSWRHLHAGGLFKHFHHLVNAAEIKHWIHALREYIEGHTGDIRVSCPFTVSEYCTLYSVGSCHKSKLGGSHCAASVIMGMKAHVDGVPVFEVFAAVLYLVGVNICRSHFHCGRKIYDDLFIRRRLPNIQHGVAYFHRKRHLGACKALR